jgi:hypothetical protein
MSTIQCFMLKPSRREDNCYNGNNCQLYEDPSGNVYHIGNDPMFLTKDGVEIKAAPVGAMWDADWYEGSKLKDGRLYNRNPDGVTLVVRTPGGDWIVDGPSFANREEVGSWSRFGTLPNVTATPSILIPGKYHGWLRDGQLVEC